MSTQNVIDFLRETPDRRLLDRALDALEWVHNADQTTDRRGVLVDMPQAMKRVRAVLREAGRLDASGVALPGGQTFSPADAAAPVVQVVEPRE